MTSRADARRSTPITPLFTVILPSSFVQIDVTGAERIPDELQRIIEISAQADAGFAGHRGLMERRIRTILRSLRKQDLAMAAILSTVFNNVLPIIATMTVAIRDARYGNLDELLDYYQRRPHYRASVAHLRRVGDCVALAFSDSARDPATGVSARALVSQWLVPIPSKPRQFLILTFACPEATSPLESAFSELFQTIADTVEFLDTDAASRETA